MEENKKTVLLTSSLLLSNFLLIKILGLTWMNSASLALLTLIWVYNPCCVSNNVNNFFPSPSGWWTFNLVRNIIFLLLILQICIFKSVHCTQFDIQLLLVRLSARVVWTLESDFTRAFQSDKLSCGEVTIIRRIRVNVLMMIQSSNLPLNF